MGTAWRYRLFHVGRMPEALKDASRSPDALLSVEGISLKITGRSVALPGVRSGRSVNLAVGSLVLSPARVMASYGKWLVLDSDLEDTPETGHTVTFSAEGMRLHVNVPDIYEGGRGTFELYYRTPIRASVLSQLPSPPRPIKLVEGIAPLARGWA